jgi:hypothetical protein
MCCASGGELFRRRRRGPWRPTTAGDAGPSCPPFAVHGAIRRLLMASSAPAMPNGVLSCRDSAGAMGRRRGSLSDGEVGTLCAHRSHSQLRRCWDTGEGLGGRQRASCEAFYYTASCGAETAAGAEPVRAGHGTPQYPQAARAGLLALRARRRAASRRYRPRRAGAVLPAVGACPRIAAREALPLVTPAEVERLRYAVEQLSAGLTARRRPLQVRLASVLHAAATIAFVEAELRRQLDPWRGAGNPWDSLRR